MSLIPVAVLPQLTGTIPEDLCEIDSLIWLNLRNNYMIGSVPSCLKNLQHLWFLELSNNSFTGPCPDLPFAQYTGYCDLQDGDRTQAANAYVCPLPPNSGSCTGGPPTCSCTGSSSSLTQPECEWWINFFDTMGGAKWTNCGSDRTDPCACSYTHNGNTYGVTCSSQHIAKL